MNHEPLSPSRANQRLHELLEVLRPDFGEREEDAQQDAAREELAELLEKQPHLIEVWHEIARIDDMVSEAVQDVVVSERFKLRLWDSIQSHKSFLTKAQRYRRRARQLNLAFLVIGASVLVVMLVAWHFMPDRFGDWQKNQVLSVASEFFDKGPSPSAQDFSVDLTDEMRAIVESYTPSEDVLQPSKATWEVVDDFLGRRAMVYRFKDSRGNRAALLVVQQEKPVVGLIDRPPRRPHLMTAGHTVGAWQSDGLLYVLVSSGNENAWRSLLVPERPVT